MQERMQERTQEIMQERMWNIGSPVKILVPPYRILFLPSQQIGRRAVDRAGRQGTGATWLLYGQNPGSAALSWALAHPRAASPWPGLAAWELGQFGGARAGGISAAGTIYKRN
jgi:hypothetical protein